MKVKTKPIADRNAQDDDLGIFAFWAQARAHLCAVDPIMASLWALDPAVPSRHSASVFEAIVHGIVSQQIANKAAARLWQKLRELATQGPMSPSVFLQAGQDSLKAHGLSRTKAQAILAVAERFESGVWTEASLRALDDAAFVSCLTQIKGIGTWTAHHVLVFGLHRPDVFPWDDFGIRTALCRHYFSLQTPRTVLRKPHDKAVKSIVCKWAPYRTVAALVLWHSLGNTPQQGS